MKERDTDGSYSPGSSREISSSPSEQLGSITKKRSGKRKRFIVARDLAIDPGLELGEELVIPKERVRKTATVSDRHTDDDNSGNYQKVRIIPKKRIRKRQKVTPTKCLGENTSSVIFVVLGYYDECIALLPFIEINLEVPCRSVLE